MENDKWYLTLNYQETKEVIGEKIENIRNNFIEIGFFLKQIRDNKTFEQDGYKSIYEFAQDIYGITRSTASRWMDINDRFSEDGNSPELAAEYKEFGKSQLQEMLYLDDKQLTEVTPEMTVREIKEIRKPEEEPVSILGYPLRVYPEGSLVTTKGCGTQSCFQCHRDGCDLRQQYCYCVEAPMGNPFPCTTLNVVDMLREEVGSSCQFVNEDLAYHRTGDGQPVPCCKKCNNKSTCGYACSRSNRDEPRKIIPEEQNINENIPCDVAQEIRHFTSDFTIDNAYGWTWHEVIGEYFKNGYANPEKESTVNFLGKTYKVLKRADVTVFYDENGKTLFDVTNDRLQEEYERGNRKKEEITTQDEQLPGQMEIHDYKGICPDQDTSIDELDLSVRTYNCLKRAGIDTIEQLKGMSNEELSKVRNFGKMNMDEVHWKLKEYDAAGECATSHTEKIVIPEEDIVVETGEIVIENEESVVEEELIEERTEKSDMKIVEDTLAKENKFLSDMRKCYAENDWRVRKQKLLVGALANYLCELEKVLYEESEQPELPVLKNNDMRKAFIDDYTSWPLWLETKETEERYYRYNLPDGSAIVVREYKYLLGWRNEECIGKELFLLKDDTKHFKNGETNMTTLIEHLKEVQKK